MNEADLLVALRVPRVGINNGFSVKEYFNLIN